MSWTQRGLAPAVVAVVLGLAACSEGGCARELPVTVAPTDTIMTVEQLEDLIWPDTKDRWNPVPERELVALEKLVVVLLERAEAGYLGATQVGRFQRLVAEAGLELRVVEVQLPAGDGMRSVETLWVLNEAADDRRGRGTYVFRIGALEPRRRGRVEHLLQAPHSRFDKYSGTIALGLFVERDVGVQPPRALFVNSTHRYRQFDGSRVRLVPATRNPADAAHRTDHPLARATASALRERQIAVVQLHGFERNFEIGDPELIISSGVTHPSKTSAATRERLREAFPASSIAHYGVDANRLGGETNVQGRAARTERRCFIHIETCESLRQQLRSDREARRRFAAAVFGADGEELSGGCK